MIQVEQVSKWYGNVKAVDDISFTVKEGTTLVLLGTSGCGKTTTLRMINRLIEPSSGTIILNNQLITAVSAEILRRQIGYVLQHTGLFPHYSIAENMAIVPKLLKWPDSRISTRILELLPKLHLSPNLLTLYPHQLSGGQQQRIGLARALMADPPVLLMDEPFGALDPVTRAGIRQEFKNLDELKRKTIILVTHDVPEAFELGDRICLMDQGKIKQIGTPVELLFRPQNEFVQSFLHEQRLQLQMKAVKLSLFQKFKLDGYPADFSLWEAASHLLLPGNTNNSIMVKDENTAELRPANLQDLLAILPDLKHTNG